MIPQEIIRRKRDNNSLSTEEINEFVKGISSNQVADAQIAAMTMAIFFNGMNLQETIDLTKAMRDSGNVMSWSGYDKPIVDKHSSGGVGDKVSLMLAPILAACDVYVPMIAGRGLGHTGGTIDKLEAIPGYNTGADNDLFRRVVKNIGCAIIGQTENLAPADKKIYAIRDVCATVESIPLITASILAKKLAAGLEYLIMDLKCGNGAFMEKFDDALILAQSIVKVATGAGTKTSAIITDMNQVLGTTVGNALEIKEALNYLKNNQCNNRLDIITRSLCAKLLFECARCSSVKEAEILVDKAITSGSALEKFSAMVFSLGGPKDFVENADKYLPRAEFKRPVFAKESGYITAMNTHKIGISNIKLKGARSYLNEKLDLSTGYENFIQIGDKVDNKTPLAVIHYQNEEQYETVRQDLYQSIVISPDKPELHSPILKII